MGAMQKAFAGIPCTGENTVERLQRGRGGPYDQGWAAKSPETNIAFSRRGDSSTDRVSRRAKRYWLVLLPGWR